MRTRASPLMKAHSRTSSRLTEFHTPSSLLSWQGALAWSEMVHRQPSLGKSPSKLMQTVDAKTLAAAQGLAAARSAQSARSADHRSAAAHRAAQDGAASAAAASGATGAASPPRTKEGGKGPLHGQVTVPLDMDYPLLPPPPPLTPSSPLLHLDTSTPPSTLTPPPPPCLFR